MVLNGCGISIKGERKLIQGTNKFMYLIFYEKYYEDPTDLPVFQQRIPASGVHH